LLSTFVDTFPTIFPLFLQEHLKLNHLAKARFGMRVAFESRDGATATK
jgi:hypothetical protein